MDILELRVRASRSDLRYPVVEPLINGRSLIDLAREAEVPYARADGQPTLAGSYEALAPREWSVSRPALFGLMPGNERDGRVAVLGCECGEMGCWPLAARIAKEGDRIVWQDFVQPHRTEWRYETLGPFVFERAAYEQAVHSAGQHHDLDV